MKYTLMLLALMSVVSHVEAKTFVYVSCGGDKQIACFAADNKTGELKLLEKITTEGAPGAMAVDATNTYLFVALRSTKGVGTYKIDAATGKLTLIATQTVGVNPVYLTVNKSRSHLFLASYSDGKVAAFPLSEAGKVQVDKGQWFDAEKKAHAILFDPSGKYSFVPHTGPNAMYQFVWNEKQGKLAFNEQKKIIAPAGTGPRHLAYHPSGKYVFTSDELGSSSTVYNLDQQTGRLTALQTVSTLPKGFKSKNSCADVEIAPSAKFLYVSNRGHDSIAIFAIDQTTGKLKVVGQEPTEKTPRSFNLTPEGKFLYAAGQGSGKLVSYKVNLADGTLSRFKVQEVGKSPSWVEAVTTK